MLEKRSIRRTSQKLTIQIKDFLLSEKSREFFVFLFFFLIAGGFWMIQTLDNDYEAEFSVPVRMRDVPDNVVITSEPVSKISVRLKDKGTVLLNYMLGKGFYPITIEFSESRNSDNHVRILSDVLKKKLQTQLRASTSIQHFNPDTLDYIYSMGSSKRVPVRFAGYVNAARRYYVSDTIFIPDSVQVYAPSQVLDTITAAYTTSLNIDEITDTMRVTQPLRMPKGVKYVPSVVETVFPTDIYMEQTLEVPLIGVGFPVGKTLRAFPSKVQISFQLGMSRYRQVDASAFRIYVPYEELQKLGSEKYTLQLGEIPDGVTNVRISPSQIDFLIEQSSNSTLPHD
ncbi:MAG: YbbR-like domain-containing protein [Mediterranea massiliensis]|nr:YbbR-like domain-containing protein [Mediterranea massiliensis]